VEKSTQPKVRLSVAMGTRGIFFHGWALMGSKGRKSPCRVQGQLPGRGLGRSPLKPTTFSQNDALIRRHTEVLDNICSKKKSLFSISRGHLAYARGRPCVLPRMRNWQSMVMNSKYSWVAQQKTTFVAHCKSTVAYIVCIYVHVLLRLC